MKYKTLFRLALKLIGFYMILSSALGMLGLALNMWATTRVRGNWEWNLLLTPVVLSLCGGGIGLYLFRTGGKWIVDLAIPSNRPYCHECGYDLTGAAGNVCNECGTPFRAPEVTATND